MLYFTIIVVVCAATAPIGTFALGFRDRIRKKFHCYDADHKHLPRQSFRDAGLPKISGTIFQSTKRFSREDEFGNPEIEEGQSNQKIGGGKKLLWVTSDSFELNLNDDLKEVGEVSEVADEKPTTPRWKRKRSLKTNLKDVEPDAEIDMNKRIERLARETSLQGDDTQDSMKDSFLDDISLTSSTDGKLEVIEIFSGKHKERSFGSEKYFRRRRLRETQLEAPNSGKYLWMDGPRYRNYDRHHRKRKVLRMGKRKRRTKNKSDNAEGDLRNRETPQESQIAVVSFAKRRKSGVPRSFLYHPFRRKFAHNEVVKITGDKADEGGAHSLYVTERIKYSTEFKSYLGPFEKKMKEFRTQQKVGSTECTLIYPAEDIMYRNSTICTPVLRTGTVSSGTMCPLTTGTPECFSEQTTDPFTNIYTYALPDSEDLSPERYLKIRHALRNYLIKTNVWSQDIPRKFWGRKRRCSKKCNVHKIRKSPPLMCLLYVKKGQDDMLKFLMNVMQSMLDKSCDSQKPYPLDKLQYKSTKVEDSWERLDENVVIPCEVTTQKYAAPVQCGAPIAIFPYPLPIAPCFPGNSCGLPIVTPSTSTPVSPTTSPSTTRPSPRPPTCPPATCPPATLPPVTCPLTSPSTCLSTLAPTCPPIFASLPTTPAMPFSVSLYYPEPPKLPSPNVLNFEPCPTMVVPTYLPPWPTTKSTGIDLLKCSTDAEPGCGSNMDTLQPWPTPPPFLKCTTSKNHLGNGYRNEEYQSPILNYFEDAKNRDYVGSQKILPQKMVVNPDGSTISRFDIESMYDSPEQETAEEAEFDIHSSQFDYWSEMPKNSFENSYATSTYPAEVKIVRTFDDSNLSYPGQPMKRRRRKRRRRKKGGNRKKDQDKTKLKEQQLFSRNKRDDSRDRKTTEELDVDKLTEANTPTLIGSTDNSTVMETTPSAIESKTEAGDNTDSMDKFESYADDKSGKKPPTLKSAVIVRGPKRLSNRPQTKVFEKVFPESYSYTVSENSTLKIEKTKASTPSNNSTMHSQLLAVCQGYLDMIKLLNVDNKTSEVGLDRKLIEYCEDELSRGSKDNSLLTTTEEPSTSVPSQVYNALSKQNLRNKVVVDILGSPIYKEMRAHAKAKDTERYNSGRLTGEISRIRRKRKRRRGYTGLLSRSKDMDNEDVDSVRLLKKRKGDLISWLFDKEEQDNLPETEYIDNRIQDDYDSKLNKREFLASPSSSSVRQEETSKSTSPETIYPIYARKYGYDKGGELRELELLWRAATGQNQTKEILKNMTVLAMLFNPEEQERDAGFADESANDSPELLSDTAKQEFHSKLKSVLKKPNGTVNLVPENEEEDVNEMVEDVTTTEGDGSTEVTTILGHTSNGPLSTIHQNHTGNGTYAHAVSTAKELVKDYTIEFLNYAVYIIPIMFILLFLLCCVCFILKIMSQNRKRRKFSKKKRKEVDSSSSIGSYSDTTDSSVVGKREEKKKKSKKMEALKHKSKKLWAALKSRKKDDSDGEEDDEDGKDINKEKERSKDKNFLRFLRKQRQKKMIRYDDDSLDDNEKIIVKSKRKKSRDIEDFDSNDKAEQNVLRQKRKKRKKKSREDNDRNVQGEMRTPFENDSNYTDDVTEDRRIQRHRDTAAKERRELIALLEELKNMESEEPGSGDGKDKKEYKTVYVQYMTQEEEKEENQTGFSRGRNCFEDEHSAFFDETPGDPVSIEGINSLQCGTFNRTVGCRLKDDYQGRFCSRGVGTQSDRMQQHDLSREQVLDKFINLSRDMSAELMEGTAEDIAFKFDMLTRMFDHLTTGNIPPGKKYILLAELENFKRRLGCRKSVTLKDDGVLCRP